MHDQENNDLIARWEQAYGSTFVYKGFVGGCRLMTTDPVAIAYILRNAYDYPKPDFVRESLATMAAGHHGLLVVEGDEHRRQVRSVCPSELPARLTPDNHHTEKDTSTCLAPTLGIPTILIH